MIEVRRILTQVEDIFHEGGPPAAQPLRRGAIGAVLKNPYAGRYVDDPQDTLRLGMPATVRIELAGDAARP